MSGDLPLHWLVALAAAAGFGLGWLHFASLARVAALLVAGNLWAVGLQLLRLAVLAGFLILCARGGAMPLIAGAAGVLAARALVLRRAR